MLPAEVRGRMIYRSMNPEIVLGAQAAHDVSIGL